MVKAEARGVVVDQASGRAGAQDDFELALRSKEREVV